MKQSPSKSNLAGDSVFGNNAFDPDSMYQFYSPLTCARNSRRYLNTDRKGRFIDDGDIAAQNAISKASLFRASTRGNDPAATRNMEFSPTRGGSLNRGGSRINEFSPPEGKSKSRTNLDATGVSLGSVLQKQTAGQGGVNFKSNTFGKTNTSFSRHN